MRPRMTDKSEANEALPHARLRVPIALLGVDLVGLGVEVVGDLLEQRGVGLTACGLRKRPAVARSVAEALGL